MPLQALDSQSYIRRVRLMIDSDKRDKAESKSPFDFVYNLNNLYEKVVGIELVGYNMKRDAQQMFTADSGTFAGNNYVDVFMDDVATQTNPYYFTVVIPERDYTSQTELAADLVTLFNTAMDAGGHAFHNTANLVFWAHTVIFSIGLGSNAVIDHVIEEGAGANIDTVVGQYLFGTGANAHRSAARPLGFPDGRDTNALFTYSFSFLGFPATQTENTPFILAETRLDPYRFIEVRIEQFPELDPVARIPLLTDNDATPQSIDEANANVRLLTNPVNNIDTMHIKLTLPDNRPPAENSFGGFDLVFDLLLLSPETKIPGWVKQKFLY